MPFKPIEIEKMLIKKLGMTTSEADHKWLEVEFEGLPPIRTKLPHHGKDIGPGLEGRIHRQLRIRKNFYLELMCCTKYKEDYEAILRKDPYPPFDQLIV